MEGTGDPMEPTAAQYNLAHLRVKGRSGFFGLRPKNPSLSALDTPARSVVGRLWLVPLGGFSGLGCKEAYPNVGWTKWIELKERAPILGLEKTKLQNLNRTIA